MQDLNAIIDAAPQNQLIQNTLMKMHLKLNSFSRPACSVSGGSDSDIMLDICERVRGDRTVRYVFFDTGIEYQATKRHLDELERKYGIEIERRDAVVPVPLGCKQYGQPFLSKMVADYIDRLQTHGFQWEDEPYEILKKRYTECKSALKFWCNAWPDIDGKKSKFNISNFAYLKEFMVENHPQFRISKGCCDGAKKETAGLFDAGGDINLKILGLRQAEGGTRATAYTSCFSVDSHGLAQYRPLWFWSDADKAEYKAHYGVIYSDCYEVWGFKGTGCAGCPFGSRFEDELATMEQYEPKMAQAANNIFGDAYDYNRAYREYRDRKKELARTEIAGQARMEDYITPQHAGGKEQESETDLI